MSELTYNDALASTASAQKQMEFQERMSNTAHQREVADLKAAGLNPILSAHSQGASTPSGAEGDYSEVLPYLVNTLSSVVSSNAKALSSSVKSIKNMVSSTTSVLKDTLTANQAYQEELSSNQYYGKSNLDLIQNVVDAASRGRSLPGMLMNALGETAKTVYGFFKERKETLEAQDQARRELLPVMVQVRTPSNPYAGTPIVNGQATPYQMVFAPPSASEAYNQAQKVSYNRSSNATNKARTQAIKNVTKNFSNRVTKPSRQTSYNWANVR